MSNYRKLTLFFGLFIAFGSISAQDPQWLGARSGSVNFFEICRKADSSFAGERTVFNQRRGFSDGEYVQYQRWKWYWEKRVDEQGNFPEFSDESLQRQAPTPSTQSAWTNISQTTCIGGYNGMGRATCIAFDPVNPAVMYVGAPIGGLWKTTDGGLTYTALTDALPYVSVGSCVVDYSNSSVLYISVGDHQGWWNFSRGIYKSTDGGATWAVTGLNWQFAQGRAISKIVMDPFNPQILFAATSNGLYKTINGGTNWTVARTGYYSDIEFEPGTSNIYAALHDYWGSSEVFRSTDGGSTWNALTSFAAQYNWIRLAVTPANAAKLAVMCSINNNPLYISTNYGANLNYVADVPEGSVLHFSPTNANILYCGGLFVQKSTDGGATWNVLTWWYNNPPYSEVHADQRNVEFHPLVPDLIYFCNDGGLYSYSENSGSFTELTNGFVTTQFYKIAISQSDPNIIIGGTQDNGGRLRDQNGQWRSTNGGDGMDVAIDPTDNDVIYTTYIYGKLYRSMDRWVNDTYYCISDNIPGGTPPGSWVAPYMLDPSDNSTIIAGYDDVWRSIDRGNTWNALSSGIFGGSTIECLAVAASDPNTIWVSSDTSISMTSNLGGNWSAINNPSDLRITSLTVSPTNTNDIWITCGGYTAAKKVYYSANAGATWTNLTTGLPNTAVNTSLYEIGSNDRIYVGTDAGVYVRDPANPTWTLVGTGLPNTAVTDLEIYYATGMLRAGTYGRGIWETSVALFSGEPESPVQPLLEVMVIPNPAGAQSQADICSSNSGLIQLHIYNSLGQMVWSESVESGGNNTRVLLPDLNSGQYAIEVVQGDNVCRNRFIAF